MKLLCILPTQAGSCSVLSLYGLLLLLTRCQRLPPVGGSFSQASNMYQVTASKGPGSTCVQVCVSRSMKCRSLRLPLPALPPKSHRRRPSSLAHRLAPALPLGGSVLHNAKRQYPFHCVISTGAVEHVAILLPAQAMPILNCTQASPCPSTRGLHTAQSQKSEVVQISVNNTGWHPPWHWEAPYCTT